MKKIILFFVFFLYLAAVSPARPIVIAHRGASGKYPENTPASFKNALDYADFLEQDLQLTNDDKLIVFHDIILDNVTDVAKIYPKNRRRKDGRYYVRDFTLEELSKLTVSNRHYKNMFIDIKIFKNRKYKQSSENRIISFDEVLEMVNEYNNKNTKKVGIYPELKDIWFYKSEGKDMSRGLLENLIKYGYDKNTELVFIQSFDSEELKLLKSEIFPEYNVNFRLVQLIPKRKSGDIKIYENGSIKKYDYKYFYTKEGLLEISRYADAIGPDKSLIYGSEPKAKYLSDAKEAGLLIHAFTFNTENVLKSFKNYNEELLYFINELKIDGYFTDYPEIELK